MDRKSWIIEFDGVWLSNKPLPGSAKILGPDRKTVLSKTYVFK